MASLLLWAVLWEIVGRLELTILIPPLSTTLGRLVEIVGTGSFWDAMSITMRTFLWGSAIAIMVGVPVGILMGRVGRPRPHAAALGEHLHQRPALGARAGHHGAVRLRRDDDRPHRRDLRDLDHHPRCAGGRARRSRRRWSRWRASTAPRRWQAFRKIYVWSALPEILTGIRLGLLRAVKGVIIGQLLVSVVGFGRLFEIYSSNFLMEHMWALLIVLFSLAFLIDLVFGLIEKKVEYFASSRS